MFSLVCLPSAVDHIGMNCIGLLRGHTEARKCELWRIQESRHPLVPMSSAQHDGVPALVNIWRRVSQVGNSSVEHPRAAAVEARRVAAIAVEDLVELLALFNRGGISSLLRRFRNGRH